MKLKNRKVQTVKKDVLDFLHSPAAVRLLICVLGLTVLVAIYVLAVVPVRYSLKVGDVPQVTIAATKDVEDKTATNARREQAALAVKPTYVYQEGITEQVLEKFEAIYNELRNVSQYAQTLPEGAAYNTEIMKSAQSFLTTITLQDHQLVTVMQTPPAKLEEAYAPLYNTLQTKMIYNVYEGQETAVQNDILQIVHYNMMVHNLYNLEQRVLPVVLNACIRPNMLIDQEAYQAAQEEARDQVEPVMFRQGNNIVVKGEGTVTQNQLNILSDLGLLSNKEIDSEIYLGSGMLVAAVVIVMLYFLYTDKLFWQDWKKLLILFVTMIITLALSVAARLVHAYLVPALLTVYVIAALFGKKAGLAGGIAMVLLAASLAAGGNQTYGETMALMLLTGVVSATVAALMLDKKASRLQLIITGLVCSAVNFVLILSVGLMTSKELDGVMINALWSIGATMVSALLAIGILPVLESVFNLATPMKLMELSNPNQPLLRKLMLEAPGTYHHSIIVANLAEAAAEAIGANPLLARVGGYYHDIGKLKRPSYFKENQMGEKNAHDDTDPYVSAAIVTAHTMDGVSMGKSYRLPPEVLEIVGSHHGDTPVMYFYHKAVQLAGDGETVDMDTFRYNGHPPKSAEAAVVLLCDTIEAAVRTLPNPTPEAMEEFIVKLVRGKLEDGQLSDSPLTLRDIDKVCAAVTTVLSGVFHERIEYPEVKHGPQRIVHAVQEEIKEAQQEKQEQAEKTEEAEQMTLESIIMPEPEAEPAPILDVEKILYADNDAETEEAAQQPEETDGEA